VRVLYIDDDRVQALLFGEVCRVVGLTDLEVACDGAEALHGLRGAWAPWLPDLLVIDLHLPDTDGLQLLPALRAALAEACVHAAVPAVLCTADEPDLVAAQARAAGFDDCWTKPVTPELLRRAQCRYAPGIRPASE
jgi:two-component system OmpR family response regulator